MIVNFLVIVGLYLVRCRLPRSGLVKGIFSVVPLLRGMLGGGIMDQSDISGGDIDPFPVFFSYGIVFLMGVLLGVFIGIIAVIWGD